MSNEVTVLTTDLQRILESLNVAYYRAHVEDLDDGYRKLQEKPRQSPQTKNLEETLTMVQAYIESAEEEEEEVESDDVSET